MNENKGEEGRAKRWKEMKRRKETGGGREAKERKKEWVRRWGKVRGMMKE